MHLISYPDICTSWSVHRNDNLICTRFSSNCFYNDSGLKNFEYIFRKLSLSITINFILIISRKKITWLKKGKQFACNSVFSFYFFKKSCVYKISSPINIPYITPINIPEYLLYTYIYHVVAFVISDMTILAVIITKHNVWITV